MAELGHKVFESNTTVNTSSTTPITAYTIATAAELDTSGSAEYVLIISALIGATSGGTTNNNRNFEIHDNGTLIPDTNARLEPNSVTDGEGQHYGIVRRFTKASSGDITFEIYNPDAINTAVMTCNAVLILLDDIVENADFIHATSGADNDISSYRDGASLVIPADASEKWLVFAMARWDDDTIDALKQLKIVDDTTDIAEIILATEDVSEFSCSMTTYPVDGVAFAKTVKLQIAGDGGDPADLIMSEMIALRLGMFKKADFAKGGTTTVVASDTFVELDTLALTANHTGDHWMMGGGVFAEANVTNRRERQLTSEIASEGEIVQAGSSVKQLHGGGNTTDEDFPVFLVGDTSFTDADSLTFDIDVGDSVNATNEGVSAGWVAAGTWELATALQRINFKSAGTWDSNTTGSVLNPGDPAGVATDDLLICVTCNRVAGRVIDTGMSGWLELHSVVTDGSLKVFGRIATGGSEDSPTPDWDNTNQVEAVVLRYIGDVPAAIGDLIPASGETSDGGGSGSGDLPLPPTTAPTVTDALVFAVARKNKTGTSDGAIVDNNDTEFIIRTQDAPNSVRNMIAVGDWQQFGSGANYDGDDWAHTPTGDALTANSIILYFESAAAGPVVITDVDGDEAWNDGDTGLVITGTGFV